jgi:hypothetical protein
VWWPGALFLCGEANSAGSVPAVDRRVDGGAAFDEASFDVVGPAAGDGELTAGRVAEGPLLDVPGLSGARCPAIEDAREKWL